MTASPEIILYGYSASPFYQKMLLVIRLKQLPFSIVKVNRQPPRPELEVSLGITYRRIPVLAIGNDVYCDTAIAIQALESRFPNVGLDLQMNGLRIGTAAFWPDRAIFKACAALMPKELWTPEFIVDRSAFSGAQVDPVRMEQARPMILSQLRTHCDLIEDQLNSSSTNWLESTAKPTFIDVSFYFVRQIFDLPVRLHKLMIDSLSGASLDSSIWHSRLNFQVCPISKVTRMAQEHARSHQPDAQSHSSHSHG